ncbi:hypothetical protein BaRGS_00011191 [Batillaria attramentaria]|uniref:Tesmin/TSO1-like CXC domain-containing protein n=1 Tax=Batillaria attramentaria TaxID=370345 RepID=A0ABD0LEF7_9CAEN
MSAPSPLGHGWKLDAEDASASPVLTVEWMTAAPAYSSVLELVKCGCKKETCSSKRCGCQNAGLPCTDLRQCMQCENRYSFEVDQFGSQESDFSSDDDDDIID